MDTVDIPVCCCICSATTSMKKGAAVQINVTITWDFPKWGNFLTGSKDQGVAIICDPCFKKNIKDWSVLQSVIEFRNQGVIYHYLEWIKTDSGRLIPSLK